MAYQVAFETVAAEPMAAVAASARQPDLPRVIPPALDKVHATLRAGDHGPLGRNVVLYRPAADGGRAMDLNVGVRLVQPFAGEGEVQPCETPAGRVAHVVYWGAYSLMRPAHEAAQTGAMSEGHRLTGVSWEVYGDESADPAKRRTDIYYLLEDVARG